MALPQDVHITSALLWRSAVFFALLDATLLSLLARWVSPATLRDLQRTVLTLTAIFWFCLWLALASILYWGRVYAYVFPAWSRWLLPPGQALLTTMVAAGAFALATRLPGLSVVAYCLLGGVWGALGHTWGVFMGLVDKPPMLRGASPVAAVTIAFFEFTFYFGTRDAEAAPGRRLALALAGRSISRFPSLGDRPMTPTKHKPARGSRDIVLVASGDSRLSANRVCWPAQHALEENVKRTFAALGRRVVRGHPVDPTKGHGFIDGQARGIEIFRKIDPDAPLIVAEAVWQYTSHVLAGLTRHRGPILTLANWSGQWPGLVGMLNLNGSLTKAGISYSTIWSEDFTDDFARAGLAQWLNTGKIRHDHSHARPVTDRTFGGKLAADVKRGVALGEALRKEQAILGVFDEGCMGMFNAIIPDHLLHGLGLFKERLSQSALFAAMQQVPDVVARAHYEWLKGRGMRFKLGADEATELTEQQVLEGLKMYDAAVRLAHTYGCAAIGIQYQQGLKDTCVASDLAEGLLNNPDRPPVGAPDGSVLFDGRAVTHFNEADECAGVDGIITDRVWRDLKIDPSNTLHDVRWGADVWEKGVDEFVWVFEISGAAPASHFIDGYAGAVGERQPPMYFPKGGATIKGVSKPGEIVWSRIYVQGDALHMDIGRGGVVRLSDQETERRWHATTPQWPIMHAVLYGVSRDQLMAKHQANHIEVAYAPSAPVALKALVRKASMARALGIKVNLCGDHADRLDAHQPQAFRMR
jgi:hypothetical protein